MLIERSSLQRLWAPWCEGRKPRLATRWCLRGASGVECGQGCRSPQGRRSSARRAAKGWDRRQRLVFADQIECRVLQLRNSTRGS